MQDAVDLFFQKAAFLHDSRIAAAVFPLYLVYQENSFLKFMETALIEFELLQMGADAGALLIQRIVQIQQLCSRIRKGFILMQRMQQAIAFIDGRNASLIQKGNRL